MPVTIHGKEYRTVAERVDAFREVCPDYSIETQLVFQDDEKVIMKALISKNGPMVIGDHLVESQLIATGYAEEMRAASNINRSSCLEVAETSAVGRALAFYGLGGTEIASADEVAGAIKAQAAQELLDYMALVREHWHTVAEVKNLLHPQWGELENQPNVTDARAILKELGDDTYVKLWKAPTKGGVWTTVERTLLKEPERAEQIVGAAAL